MISKRILGTSKFYTFQSSFAANEVDSLPGLAINVSNITKHQMHVTLNLVKLKKSDE